MKMRSVVPMRIAKIGYIAVAAVLCLVGLWMILLPESFISVVGKFFGITMIVFGIVKLIGYFSRDLYRLAFQYDLQFGILLLLLGIIITAKPGNTINFLCVSVGILMAAESLFKGKIALEAKKFGIRFWWPIFSLAILSGIVGLLLILSPSEATRVIIILLGVSLLSEGILSLSIAVSMVKIVKNQMPDVVEIDFDDGDDDHDEIL